MQPGERLKQWREGRKLTRVQLAKKLRINASNVFRIEERGQEPSLTAAVRIERESKGRLPCRMWVPQEAA